MTIKKLVAGAKGNSSNSKGRDIVDTVNQLVDGAGIPAVNYELYQKQPIGITKPVERYGQVVANFTGAQWSATLGSPTVTADYSGYDSSGNVTGIKSRTGQTGMLLVVPTVTTTTRINLNTPATNLLTPALNGKLGLWVYIESAASDGNVNISIDFEISTAPGASSSTNGLFVGFSPNCLREGWNFLTFVMRDFRAYQAGQNVTEDHPVGVNAVTYGTGENGNIIENPITFIRANISGSTAVGTKIYFDSIWTDFSAKPQIILGCDGGINDVEIALPIFEQYGWIGYTAYPYRVWTSGSKVISNLNGISLDGEAMYAAGWDFTNHTANHLQNGTLTSASEIDYELTVAQAWQNALGFERGAEFYVSPQSSTSRLAEKVIAGLGYKLQRHAKHRNNHVTPFGVDNTSSIGSYDIGSATQSAFQSVTNNSNTLVNGWQQFSKIKREIDVAIAYGYADFPFWHGITTVGDNGTGEGLTGDNLLIYASAFTKMCEYIREKELAGEIEVCRGMTGFYYGVQ